MKNTTIRLFAILLVIACGAHLQAQDDIFGDETDLGTSGEAGELDNLTIDDPSAQAEDPVKQKFDEGKALQEQGKWAESIAIFKQVADLTNRAEPFLEQGRSYIELGLDREAEEALSRAILAPGAATVPGLLFEGHLMRGKLLLKSPNRYPDAVEDFAFAVQFNPASPEAHYFSGRATLLQVITSLGQGTDQSGQASLQGAMQALTKAIELKPDYGESYLDRGRVLLRLRQINFAVEDQEKAVQLLGATSKAQADLAFSYRSQAAIEANKKDPDVAKIKGDYQKAIAAMTTFLENYKPGERRNPWDEPEPLDIHPNSVLIARSETYLALGDELNQDSSYYQKAIDDCDRFLAFESTSPSEQAQVHFDKGLAFRMMDKLDVAIDEFGEAIRLSKQTMRPFYPDANLRRGIIYYRQGKYDSAITDFEEAKLNLNNPFQSDPRAMFWLGLTYVQKGDLPKAVQSYTRAIRGYPDYGMAYVNRGLVYMKLGRFDAALSDFNTMLRLDSSHEKANAYREVALTQIQKAN